MFEYELPDVGEGVAEGEIVVWHAEPGDQVSEDEVLAEVETDKAVVDLPAPVDGVVEELHADTGDMVPVGQVVVTIDTDADGEPDTEQSEGTVAGANGTGAKTGANGTAAGVETNGTGAETGADGAVAAAAEDGANVPEGRVFAPPNVRQLARELGVDIGTVEGSGPGGRITRADVRTAAEDSVSAPSADEATVNGQETEETSAPKSAVSRREPADTGETAGGVEPADRDRTLAVPATRGVASELDVDIDAVPTDRSRDGEAFVQPEDVRAYAEAQQTAQAADAAAVSETTTEAETTTATTNTTTASTETGARTGDTTAASAEAGATTGEPATAATETGVGDADATDEGAVRREPYRGVRQTIGEAMAESAYTAPHASHHDMAPAGGLVEARQRLKPRAEDEGVHLTYMPFVMKAVAAVLPEYPAMNAQLDEDAGEILYHDRYDIGVAVATDAGLMVPVVEDVDRKGLVELAAEVNDLVERARNRELAPEELQGSTFTITNFGAIGGEYATPILNYPETGILGLGELRQRPVVEDGEVVAGHTLPLSVSIDHRVVDGAVSAGFCNDLKTYLEDPIHLLL